MFPQQVEALHKGTPAADPKPAPAPAPASKPAPVAPAPTNATVTNRRDMVLTIDGERHEVIVEKLDV